MNIWAKEPWRRQPQPSVEQRRQDRQARQVVTQEWNAAQEPLIDLSGLVDVVAQATLVAAGYHRPKLGNWKRRRYDSDRQPARGN